MKFAIVLAIILNIFSGIAVSESEDGTTHVYPGLHDTNVVFAVDAINKRYNTPRAATRILSATANIADGITYKYEIEVTNGTDTEKCNVTVKSRPWMPLPNLHAEQIDCIHDAMISDNNETETGSSTSSTRYPPLRLDTDALSALLFFVERFNAPRSVHYRFVPYDVTVQKSPKNTRLGFLFKFSLRMVATKCFKPSMELFGKITLNECPPMRDNLLLYDRPKCTVKVYWNPTSLGAMYTFKYSDFKCPKKGNSEQ